MPTNFLKFPVPPTILSTYNTPHNQELFDANDSTLIVYVQPDGRSQITNALSARGISRGITAINVRYPTVERGFEFTTRDEREAVMMVLNELRTTAEQGNTTITVLDYLRPDSGTFTQREMIMLDEVTPNGGSWVDPGGNRWYSGGFSVEMLEVDAAT